MERYTIEDIEILRRKSGISYEEAVNLLEYHNGNLARALVDLERNGRMKPQADQKHFTHTGGVNAKKASNFFGRLYRFRFVVKKGSITIINLSLLFSLISLLISPHLVILGLIVLLVLGYRVSFVTDSTDFAGENLESMVKNAAQNVKSTVNSFAKEFTPAEKQESPKQEDSRSFYQSETSRPAPVEQTPPAPKAQTTPVSVQYQDNGKVEVREEDDGFSEATIE